MRKTILAVWAAVLLAGCASTDKQPAESRAEMEQSINTEQSETQESISTMECPSVHETTAAADSSTVSDISESETDSSVQEAAGTWRIDGQKTENANKLSLIGEFGTGIHLGNEMVLTENGDFSYHIAINRGGEGRWRKEGNVITADFTTYEPEVQEEQLTMTLETGEAGDIFIKMTYTDGYILFWNRLEGAVPVISMSDAAFEGFPEVTDYDSIKAVSTEPVKEEEGVYGGSPAIWSTLSDGKFLYFYYTYTYPENVEPEYSNFAVTGEDIKLTCGLHVGMTAKEAEAIVPGLYHFKWDNPEYTSPLDWNSNAIPQSWCRQFPQILIAEVDDSSEMPLTIGLMLDLDEIIRAIAFNQPTAG